MISDVVAGEVLGTKNVTNKNFLRKLLKLSVQNKKFLECKCELPKHKLVLIIIITSSQWHLSVCQKESATKLTNK